MTYNEKVDLFRYIGESLYQEYKNNQLKHFPEYDTSQVRPDTDVYALVHKSFIQPYLDTENPDAKSEADVQYVIAAIKSSIMDYDRIKSQDEEKTDKAYSLTVGKALEGDKGAFY